MIYRNVFLLLHVTQQASFIASPELNVPLAQFALKLAQLLYLSVQFAYLYSFLILKINYDIEFLK